MFLSALRRKGQKARAATLNLYRSESWLAKARLLPLATYQVLALNTQTVQQQCAEEGGTCLSSENVKGSKTSLELFRTTQLEAHRSTRPLSITCEHSAHKNNSTSGILDAGLRGTRQQQKAQGLTRPRPRGVHLCMSSSFSHDLVLLVVVGGAKARLTSPPSCTCWLSSLASRFVLTAVFRAESDSSSGAL